MRPLTSLPRRGQNRAVHRLLVLPLLLAPVACAQGYAPLPKELLDAKTIYIVNDTGWPKIADKAFKELQKWGRFIVVNDIREADVIFRFRGARLTLGGISRSNDVTLAIFLRDSPETPIWSITESGTLLVSNNAKDCIRQLRKRMPKDN